MSSKYCVLFRQVAAMKNFMVLAISVTASVEVTTSGEWTLGTYITGYWDCCKPSCSWPNKGNVNKPVRTCDAFSGETVLDPNAVSVCHGGSSAACTDQQPWIVNDGLSMGFAAAAVGGTHGLSGDANCGQCFELQFVDTIHDPWSWGGWGGSHPELVSKTHVVQVTNIGYDVNGEHSFDLQIPGAGQGAFTTGCNRQFSGYASGDFDCDLAYGGCTEVSGCSRQPSVLQRGCEWRFDWFKWLILNGQTNNPYIKFRRVQCPTELTDISGTVPLDDYMYPIHTGKTDSSQTTSGFLTRRTTTTIAATGHCSDFEEDCRETKCCVSSRTQCFRKDAYWAACLPSCSPGQIRSEDAPQYQTPWSCAVLSISPTSTVTVTTTVAVTGHCSDFEEDCRETNCCVSSTMRCYRKDAYWAACLSSCSPGQVRSEDAPQYQTPWSCAVLVMLSTTSIPSPTSTATATATIAVTGHCSDFEEDCRETKCCVSSTMQCYQKDSYWAACLPSCLPGQIRLEDAPQYQTPWSCDTLGPLPTTTFALTSSSTSTATTSGGVTQTPCSDAYVDCRSSGCCNNPAMQCYEKNDWWGQCLESCTPGIHWDEAPQWQSPWSCRLYGQTMTLTTTQSSCAADGIDCRSTGCCQNPTMQCYEKNDWWGECLESCTPGIHFDEAPQWQTPWSCTLLSTPIVVHCADESMDCRTSQCCKDPGLKCYRKDDGWAACLSTCSPGQVRWEDPPQFQTPWICDVLGM